MKMEMKMSERVEECGCNKSTAKQTRVLLCVQKAFDWVQRQSAARVRGLLAHLQQLAACWDAHEQRLTKKERELLGARRRPPLLLASASQPSPPLTYASKSSGAPAKN